jgi:hypothetical protein
MLRVGRLLVVALGLGLLTPLPAAQARTKKPGKARGKDPRAKFRAGRPPPNKRHDPIPPPPPKPAEKPHGMFHALLEAGHEWAYEVRLDGRPLEADVRLRVDTVRPLGEARIVDLVVLVGGQPLGTTPPPEGMSVLPGRMVFAVTEGAKQHALFDLGPSAPADAKLLKKALAERGASLTDPPTPRPDFWTANSYRGAQERRVDFPGGTAPASCYRWGTVTDGTLDGTELCQTLDHGPVLLTRRSGGHVLELLLAPGPDGELRADIPGPPSEN